VAWEGWSIRKVGVTANLDSSCARRLERVRIGTKKRALQIEQRNWRRKKCGALPNLLDKKASYKGPGADSEEKHEPASDIDTAVVDSLKVLDTNWPIREADIAGGPSRAQEPTSPQAVRILI
jgi:hypothetical protein